LQRYLHLSWRVFAIQKKKNPNPNPSLTVAFAFDQKIDEILSTGQLRRLENDLNDPLVQATNLVARVIGVGPKVRLQRAKFPFLAYKPSIPL